MAAANLPASKERVAARIALFGNSIIKRLNQDQPKVYQAKFWSDLGTELLFKHPRLKSQLFRFVDTFPALTDARSIQRHVREYISADIRGFNRFLGWWCSAPDASIRGWISAAVARKVIKGMAAQLIIGEDAQSALPKLEQLRRSGFAFTADLLGEYTLSEKEGDAYLDRYRDALRELAMDSQSWSATHPKFYGHTGEHSLISISVKLSALYPHCHALNQESAIEELSKKLSVIVREARTANASLFVDAEDSATNVIIYKVFEQVFLDSEFRSFPYPGIVVQAYAKNSDQTLMQLIAIAKKRNSPISVRLVKGAYWDSENINAELNGWPFPLFRNKESSDMRYEQLSEILLENHEFVYPAFGSHNVRSLAHACCYAAELGISKSEFELQVLYGMALPIAKAFLDEGYLVRHYVPLGDLVVGMGYLVRRLLENTSNESFLLHFIQDNYTAEKLLRRPIFKG